MSSLDSIRSLLPQPYSSRLESVEEIARLWAGYGHIYRLHLRVDDDNESVPSSVILKYISPPASASSDTQDESKLRKLSSYLVETNFYQSYSDAFNTRYSPRFETPTFLARISKCGVLLSDLDLSHGDFAEGSRAALTLEQSLAALDWFAAFHAHWWGYQVKQGRDCPTTRDLMGGQKWEGEGVWAVGTYNYLTTRLEELQAVSPSSAFAELRGPLAFAVEYQLLHPQNNAGRTLVHGDAKSANLALRRRNNTHSQSPSQSPMPSPHYPPSWTSDAHKWDVSMYDFQYVGAGVPTQDLIKFLATAIPASHLWDEEAELKLLHFYHDRLLQYGVFVDDFPFETFHHQWKLSLLSWVRFTQGWGSWGNTTWLEKRAREILRQRQWVDEVVRVWEHNGKWGQEILDEMRL